MARPSFGAPYALLRKLRGILLPSELLVSTGPGITCPSGQSSWDSPGSSGSSGSSLSSLSPTSVADSDASHVCVGSSAGFAGFAGFAGSTGFPSRSGASSVVPDRPGPACAADASVPLANPANAYAGAASAGYASAGHCAINGSVFASCTDASVSCQGSSSALPEYVTTRDFSALDRVRCRCLF